MPPLSLLHGPRRAVILALAVAAAAPLAVRPLADRIVAGSPQSAAIAEAGRAALPPRPRPSGIGSAPADLARELGVSPVSVTYLRGSIDAPMPETGDAPALRPPADRAR